MIEQLFLFIISLISNILSAMAGGGAGLIQLPALVFMGLPLSVALATHKIASVALGIGASLKHAKASIFEKKLIVYLLAFGLPGVIVGAKTILLIPENTAKIILGLLTLALGVYSIFKSQLGLAKIEKTQNLQHAIIGASVLFFIGFLNGALSSGTGLFVTLWLVAWFGCDYKQATAHTMICVGLFWNGTGAATFVFLAQVQWSWLPVLLVGSLLGGYLGAVISLNKGNKLIKRIFEITTILVGVSLIISTV